jgi:hypothetical protein
MTSVLLSEQAFWAIASVRSACLERLGLLGADGRTRRVLRAARAASRQWIPGRPWASAEVAGRVLARPGHGPRVAAPHQRQSPQRPVLDARGGAATSVLPVRYGSCSSLVRHEAYCYIARKAGRDERRLSLDLMPNQSPKGRYGKIAWQKTSGRA